ncbi:hypothetical protein TNCV_3716791 [Trichonephila clavipes]|nr:hypothetical protein TNCV_3716791 [Trichonephila clavipes]
MIGTWHYTHDDVREQRLLTFLMTLLLCLEEEFPGKQSTAVLQKLALAPNVQSGAFLWMPPAGKTRYCGAENFNCGHHKNRGVFFLMMSRNVPDKVILVESSSGEKMELAFIPPT